jgi:hypothetical protein
MKYYVRRPDGQELLFTWDELVMGHNRGDIDPAWPAKPEATSDWARVGAVIGIEPPAAISAPATRPCRPCPFCGSDSLIGGRLEGEGPATLELNGVRRRWWTLGSDSLHVESNATLCLHCGTCWARTDIAKARKLIERLGSEELRQKVSRIAAQSENSKPSIPGIGTA